MSTTIISSGEVSSGLTLSRSYDTIQVSGGSVFETSITGGTMLVTGAESYAEDTVMNGSCSMNVSNGGNANKTVMTGGGYYESAHLTLYRATATSTTVNSRGVFTMQYGASAYDTVVNSGGRVTMLGGVAYNTIVNSSGTVSNCSGVIQDATVVDFGDIQVTQSGVASNVHLMERGRMFVSSGGKAYNTVIDDQSYISISGGTVCNTVVNSGGSLTQVSGWVDGVTVNYGGYYSAGFGYYEAPADLSGIGAVNVIENGGDVLIGSGSRYDYDVGSWTYGIEFPVTFLANTFEGLVYDNNRNGTVHSGTTALNITALAGGLTVYSGGIVNGYTMQCVEGAPDEWGHFEYSAGSLDVRSGGTATGIVSYVPELNGYSYTLYTFAIAPDTVISGTLGGVDFSVNNGVVANASIKYADLTMMNGAVVTNLTQEFGSAHILTGATVNGLTLSGTYTTIASNAVVDGLTGVAVPVTVWEYTGMPWDPEPGELVPVEQMAGAYLIVEGGAVVTNLNLDADSPLHVTMNNQTVVQGTSGGVDFNMANGYFGNIVLNNTTIHMEEGIVEDIVLNNGATISAGAGTKSYELTENGGAVFLDDDWTNNNTGTHTFVSNTFSIQNLSGNVTVHKNTIASDCIMGEGTLDVYSGGIVRDFYTSGGGMKNAFLSFNSGAIGSNVDMTRYFKRPSHGGHASIERDVQIDRLRLNTDDFVDLVVTPETVITNGAVDLKPFTLTGGVLSGYQTGGMNDQTTVLEGGRVIDSFFEYGTLYMEGGSAENIRINTTIYASSGSVLKNIHLGTPATPEQEEYYYYGGTGDINLYDGAVLDGFDTLNGSYINVESGAKLTGKMDITDGQADINLSSGAIIDFDLTAKDALYGARINDMSRFSGAEYGIQYYISIDEQNQASGTYILAQNVDFQHSYQYFYVEDDGRGEEYGYFQTNWNDWNGEYETYFISTSQVQPGYTFTLGFALNSDLGTYDLVFTVDSGITPTPWLAAPTVTADCEVFDDSDVTLTLDFSTDVVSTEYSVDGANWIALGGAVFVAADNGTYYFRGTNADGTVSDVASYTVSNIDKVAPTVATGLASQVEDSTVTLSWTDATDDYAGVCGFEITYWKDGLLGFLTETVPGTTLVLKEMTSGTWNWTVTALDYAGNASEAVTGGQFVVTNGYIPRLDLPDFLVGEFAGEDTARMATETDGGVSIYVNGTQWGTGLVLDPGWEIAGIGDFNADGRDDFLRVNSEGYVVGEMTQADGSFSAQVLNFKNAGWEILGTGDFDGTGYDDVLIANPTGASESVGLIGYWEGGTTWVLINGYSAEWEMIATGDFNADGNCDMLWRNTFIGDDNQTYNAYCTWLVGLPPNEFTGGPSQDWFIVSVANPNEWNYLCAGDFNGDGANDIAMINDVGVVGIWGVEGGMLSSWSILSAVNTDEWKLVGVGDFNADGTDDIAWCSNISGLAGYWQIEDKTLAGWQNIANLA